LEPRSGGSKLFVRRQIKIIFDFAEGIGSFSAAVKTIPKAGDFIK
jgi:hypothetical protein